MKTGVVALLVVSDAITGLDNDVCVDNCVADCRAPPDHSARKQDGMPHIGTRFQDYAGRQNRTEYRSALDIGCPRDDRIDSSLVSYFRKNASAAETNPESRAYRPVLVERVHRRIGRQQIHVRVIVSIEGANVTPIQRMRVEQIL